MSFFLDGFPGMLIYELSALLHNDVWRGNRENKHAVFLNRDGSEEGGLVLFFTLCRAATITTREIE